MATHSGWGRRLDKLETALPVPPAGSPYWLDQFEFLGHVDGLARREPDHAALLAAYRALVPPYGDEAWRLHGHLAELSDRARDGVPPCSAAEFAELSAWLARHGEDLPTVNGGRKDLDPGDGTTVTLSGLTWRVSRGPTAGGSGGVAETIRRLKARHEGGPAQAKAAGGGGGSALVPRGWVTSVVRDETNGDAPG